MHIEFISELRLFLLRMVKNVGLPISKNKLTTVRQLSCTLCALKHLFWTLRYKGEI